MDNRIYPPPGELIAANGSNYHVRRLGEKGPLVLMECGLTMMSSCWAWIAQELAATARLITYDRAGLGWSDEREETRDAAQIARELKDLIQAMRVREPLVLLGHSMGAMFNRAFHRQNHGLVSAMVWLDPTHPNQMKARGVRQRFRNLVFYIQAAQLLATKAVPAIEIPLIRHCQGLPEEDYRVLRRFLRNSRHLRATAREARAWEQSAEFVRGDRLGSLPLLVISGERSALPGWGEMQRDLAGASTRASHHTFPELSHLSMLANRAHARKVTEKIHRFLAELSL